MMIHFAEDICYRQGYVEGGASETIILPRATLQEGFLIANHIERLEDDIDWQENNDDNETLYLLRSQSDTELVFSGYHGVVRITAVGEMVIIYMDWSC